MGFCDYFLVVADLINYAKQNNILIGPGRGSAVGSLVAYLLNIITIDPLKYDLLFERFLNPERITMPDIDIDIEDSKRDTIINYCINKYGLKKVVPIIAFGTMGSKQAIRDIGRVINKIKK
jgi:DNA polymerase-3 subunit alpha